MFISISSYLLIIFILGPIAFFFTRYLRKWAGWFYAIVPLYGFFDLLALFPHIDQDHVITETHSWFPQYGINFSLYVDGLSEFFSLLILGIGAFILIYAGYYSKAYARSGMLMGYLILFMASMLGVVVAGNLITIFLFWELTAVFSYLLIGFDHEKEEARRGAFQAFLVTGVGGQALLAGFVLIGIFFHDFELSVILSDSEAFKSSGFYFPALLLVLAGAFTKSAQFPFHFWLPDAMVAPTPVSAYLHSATMVKAGVFLLLRLNPLLGGTEIWHYLLSLVGVTTMFLGAWFSLSETDLKRILAYTTMSALGTLVLLVGTDTEYALNAAIIYLLVHALYKGTLFMMAGVIQKQTGTREISELGGLYHYMPFAAIIACLALVSMAGIPPMLGFISKELVYEAKVHAPSAYWFVLSAGLVTNVILVFLSLRLSVDVFFGKQRVYATRPAEPALSMIIGPFILVLISLILGLFPGSVANPLTANAILDINPQFGVVELKLWSGWNLVTAISILTVILGVIFFSYRKKVVAIAEKLTLKYSKRPFSQLFNRLAALFLSLAQKETELIQHGYHRFYLITIFSFASLFIWYQLGTVGSINLTIDLNAIPLNQLAILLLIVVAGFTAIVSQSRVVSLVAMAVVGFGMTLIFIIFSGVDLPITLILAEVMTIILSMALLYYLPHYVNQSSEGARMRDAILAIAVGICMTLLTLEAIPLKMGAPVSYFFTESSLKEAFGRNIVNVILVDFRALDTLGEATVLSIAAIGVYCLMENGSKISKMPQESIILRIAAKFLTPILLILSLFAFFRGHQEPGGGFIAGLIMASAFILFAMAFGAKRAIDRIWLNPLQWVGIGLGILLISGTPAYLMNEPFLTGQWISLFGIESWKIGTPLLFDFGVFVTVAGMCVQLMSSVLEE